MPINYKLQLCTRFGTILEEYEHETTKQAKASIGQNWLGWCHRLNEKGFFSAEIVAARNDLQVVYVKNKAECLAMTLPSQKRSKGRAFTLDKTSNKGHKLKRPRR